MSPCSTRSCGGHIVFANPAFLAAFHATDGLAGVPVADIVFGADGDGLAEALDGVEHLPTRWFGNGRRADDLPFDLELCLEPASPDGEATVIAFACDVTEEHRPGSISPAWHIPIHSPDWRTARCSPTACIRRCSPRVAAARGSPC
jgi:hypothetical protein